MTQSEAGVAAGAAEDLRRMMVDGQIRTFDVTDQRVLEVFYRTPRETSLPASLAPLAYSDASLVLPPGEPGRQGRALMQPMFLAKLMQNASFAATDRVLIVAGASGYVAALVAPLVAHVVSLDSDPQATAMAARYLDDLGLGSQTQAVTGPLADGHRAGAPFDRIIVHGAVEHGLDALFAQLAPGGALLAVETRRNQATRRSGKAVRYDKLGGGMSERTLFDATVPVLDAFRAPDGFVF